jgi:RNA polymerase sigma factor (sigma-70 family)
MAISTAPAVTSLRRDGDDISDQDLVAQVRAGDDRAFERLYRRYHRRIAAYVQGMVHDHARAEDVTQDVFMSALRRMRETDRPIAFKPWVYEIAKNACIDQFRRSRRAEEVSYDAEDGGLATADYGKLVTKDPQPDVAVENKQSLDHLRGAFGGLSETHHEILVMRELEGLSYREIGERLGMTRPAVESTLFRARRRLTEEYEQLVTGERCRRVQGIIATASGSELGARDRRRLARHVSYCQPCLRHARMCGLDAADLAPTPLRAKIASLLPLPAFLKRKLAGGGDAGLGGGGGSAPDVSSSVAVWSAHASSVDPGVVSSWGKAAATAATIVVAGVGAGAASNSPGTAAALDSGSVLERVSRDAGGGPGGATTASRAAAPAAAAPVAPRPVATTKTRAERRPARRSRSRSRSRRSRGGSASGAAPATGTRGVDTGAPNDPNAGRPSSAAPATSAPAPSPAPVRDTVDRVTRSVGGETSGGSGSSGGSNSGSGGSGSTGGQQQTPRLLPNLLPQQGGDQTAGTQPAPPPSDPVTQTVEGVGQVVEGTNKALNDLVNGLLGGGK